MRGPQDMTVPAFGSSVWECQASVAPCQRACLWRIRSGTGSFLCWFCCDGSTSRKTKNLKRTGCAGASALVDAQRRCQDLKHRRRLWQGGTLHVTCVTRGFISVSSASRAQERWKKDQMISDPLEPEQRRKQLGLQL